MARRKITVACEDPAAIATKGHVSRRECKRASLRSVCAQRREFDGEPRALLLRLLGYVLRLLRLRARMLNLRLRTRRVMNGLGNRRRCGTHRRLTTEPESTGATEQVPWIVGMPALRTGR